MVEIFKIIGVDICRLIKLESGNILSSVFIPEQAISENYSSYKAIKNFFNNFSKYNSDNVIDDFVYVSRSKQTKGVFGIENEKEFELILENSGVKILHFECMNIIDQIKTWGKCKNFIGFSGSAFHLGSLLDNKTLL